jgi:tRNA A64-2'-O-ribosylphosphate transferase
LRTSEEDAPNTIASLVEGETGSGAVTSLIKPTNTLYISSSSNVDLTGFDVVISCTPSPFSPSMLKAAGIKHYLHLKCSLIGKLGSRDLRSQLPRLLQFFSAISPPRFRKILVCCPTGKDVSVGTALAILCLYTNDTGAIDTSKPRETKAVDKSFVKQRLSWITTSNPALNPSRATLQSVNAVVLESQDPKAYYTNTGNGNGTHLPSNLPIRATPNFTLKRDPETSSPSLPTTIFENLRTPAAGKSWLFTRTLTSTLPSHPSGTVTGTASFSPCTLPSSSPPTLLYAEEGEFVTNTGLKFTTRRKYVYQLQKQENEEGLGVGEACIIVRFFDDEKMPKADLGDSVGKEGEGVGGLFVEMGELEKSENSKGKEDQEREGKREVWQAKNKEQHLCAEDLYTASWKFGPGMLASGQEGIWWEVRYDVKGPNKDYVSSTRYTRI